MDTIVNDVRGKAVFVAWVKVRENLNVAGQGESQKYPKHNGVIFWWMECVSG
jgi:hypothetical protein